MSENPVWFVGYQEQILRQKNSAKYWIKKTLIFSHILHFRCSWPSARVTIWWWCMLSTKGRCDCLRCWRTGVVWQALRGGLRSESCPRKYKKKSLIASLRLFGKKRKRRHLRTGSMLWNICWRRILGVQNSFETQRCSLRGQSKKGRDRNGIRESWGRSWTVRIIFFQETTFAASLIAMRASHRVEIPCLWDHKTPARCNPSYVADQKMQLLLKHTRS